MKLCQITCNPGHHVDIHFHFYQQGGSDRVEGAGEIKYIILTAPIGLSKMGQDSGRRLVVVGQQVKHICSVNTAFCCTAYLLVFSPFHTFMLFF